MIIDTSHHRIGTGDDVDHEDYLTYNAIRNMMKKTSLIGRGVAEMFLSLDDTQDHSGKNRVSIAKFY